MIDRTHPLPLIRQAEALAISRGSVYYQPRPVSEADLALMKRIDRLHLDYPFTGSRMLRDLLNLRGIQVGRRRVRTLMRRMGIEALYRKPNTSKKRKLPRQVDSSKVEYLAFCNTSAGVIPPRLS